MKTGRVAAANLCALLVALAVAGNPARARTDPARVTPDVEQIVARNVAARGGLDAWRKLDAMAWAGHLESDRAPTYSMPFVLVQKRPNSSRFEIMAPSQHSLRVFNGTQGWKMRPGRDGAPDVQSFTAAELKFAQGAPGLDGLLIDHAARSSQVSLAGSDTIDGRDAYHLTVTEPSGERSDVWVDAETFLELRTLRHEQVAGAVPIASIVNYRQWTHVNGVVVPAVIELGSGGAGKPDRLVIEQVALNPKLTGREFSRPGAPQRRVTVTLDPRAAGQ